MFRKLPLPTSGRWVRAPNEMLYVSAATGHFWTEFAVFRIRYQPLMDNNFLLIVYIGSNIKGKTPSPLLDRGFANISFVLERAINKSGTHVVDTSIEYLISQVLFPTWVTSFLNIFDISFALSLKQWFEFNCLS